MTDVVSDNEADNSAHLYRMREAFIFFETKINKIKRLNEMYVILLA